MLTMSNPPPVPAPSPSHTLQEFIQTTAQRDRGHGLFEKETERLLEVNLNGRQSGESFQMKFEGDGFVVIQPYEEVAFQAGK